MALKVNQEYEGRSGQRKKITELSADGKTVKYLVTTDGSGKGRRAPKGTIGTCTVKAFENFAQL